MARLLQTARGDYFGQVTLEEVMHVMQGGSAIGFRDDKLDHRCPHPKRWENGQ